MAFVIVDFASFLIIMPVPNFISFGLIGPSEQACSMKLGSRGIPSRVADALVGFFLEERLMSTIFHPISDDQDTVYLGISLLHQAHLTDTSPPGDSGSG
jgi:hypothetical protein